VASVKLANWANLRSVSGSRAKNKTASRRLRRTNDEAWSRLIELSDGSQTPRRFCAAGSCRWIEFAAARPQSVHWNLPSHKSTRYSGFQIDITTGHKTGDGIAGFLLPRQTCRDGCGYVNSKNALNLP
jgi:hypothetical protein